MPACQAKLNVMKLITLNVCLLAYYYYPLTSSENAQLKSVVNMTTCSTHRLHKSSNFILCTMHTSGCYKICRKKAYRVPSTPVMFLRISYTSHQSAHLPPCSEGLSCMVRMNPRRNNTTLLLAISPRNALALPK